MDKHIFKKHHAAYLEKGISVIPDKYMSKQPAIKGWSDYCHRLPSSQEAASWCNNLHESNIAICLGEASGLVALDIDCMDDKILEVVLPMLPDSPVVKVGSKGDTRFFRYFGDVSDTVKFNGEVVVEVLSNGKKTTIAPSIHPNGSSYNWKGSSLLDIEISTLPTLPPMLLPHIEDMLRVSFPDLVVKSGNKLFSGRNDELSSFCGTLIADRVPVEDAVAQLIKKDEEINEIPLFSDVNEMRHGEAFTNALTFYTNHLNTINNKRFRSNEEYEVPIITVAINQELAKEALMGKSQAQGNQKNESPVQLQDAQNASLSSTPLTLPQPKGLLKHLINNILDNSFIKQEEFAYSASLAFMSTIIGRKVIYAGLAPNLYVLNLAPSGSGKDAPQQQVKKWLINLGAEKLLGSGDYVSDASLMDSLTSKPVRVDIIDEASGLLKAVNKGGNGYDGKMADILCELYTSSNSKFLGRALASGMDGALKVKGACFRPNVNLICSTTPAGFGQSVSTISLEKGLLGRFLIFQGRQDKAAQRLTEFPNLETKHNRLLEWWIKYEPEESEDQLGQVNQDVTKLKATDKAEKRLDEIFAEFDNMRREADSSDPLLPIIARLYQQTVKVMMIHAAGRSEMEVPVIDEEDVEFGYGVVKYYFQNVQLLLEEHLFDNKNEMINNKVAAIIKNAGEVTKQELFLKTKALSNRERMDALKALEDANLIKQVAKIEDGHRFIVYRSAM